MVVAGLYDFCKECGCNGNVETELYWILRILGSFGTDLFGFFIVGVEGVWIFIVFAKLCVLKLLISN